MPTDQYTSTHLNIHRCGAIAANQDGVIGGKSHRSSTGEGVRHRHNVARLRQYYHAVWSGKNECKWLMKSIWDEFWDLELNGLLGLKKVMVWITTMFSCCAPVWASFSTTRSPDRLCSSLPQLHHCRELCMQPLQRTSWFDILPLLSTLAALSIAILQISV